MIRYVGKLGLSTAAEIAERAIAVADDVGLTSQAKFALYIGDHQRFHVMKCPKRPLKLEGWVATFTKASDVEWLEEQIAGEAA